MSTKKIMCWLFVMTLLAIAMAGCMAPRRPVPTPNTPNAPNPNVTNPLPSPTTPTPSPNPTLTPGPNDRTIADRVQKTVNTVPGVTKSYVIVIGNTALIGIDINESRGQADEALKQRVTTATTKEDASITHVYVSADPNLVTRIRNLVDSVRQGKPISGLLTEIMSIIQKIAPTAKQ